MAFETRRLRRQSAIAASAALIGLSAYLVSAQSGVDSAVNAAFTKYQNLQEGKNADYIPALAKVDPKLFGIVVVTPDGKGHTAGG